MIQGHRTRMIRWREPSRAGSALFDWDFTQQSPGALVLPAGLTFARASSGHSVQTGTNALLVGGAIASNDVGRIGRLLDAHSYGIFVEPPRTNLYGYSRSANVAPGTAGHSCTYTTGRTGPDGGTSAIRGQTPSGGYSRFQTLGAVTGNHVLSAWAAAGLGTGAYQIVGAYAGTTGAAVQGTASATWSRVVSAAFSYPAASSPTVNPWDGRANGTLGSSAGARDCDLDFVQFEAGKYATSAIITSAGSTATRAAERLTVDSTRATQATVNGRLGFYVRFRAIAALTEMDATTEGQIICDAGGTPAFGVWIDASSRHIYLNNGSKYSQTANSVITWSRVSTIEMVMELGAGPSDFRWRIDGGSVNIAAFTARNDVLDPIVPSSGLDVLCAGTSWHTPAVIERATLFVPGRGPF